MQADRQTHLETIRRIVGTHGRMPVPVTGLSDTDDLYGAGLTSFAAVQLMLGLEEAFDVEFPERMLNRRSFASMDAIANCIGELTMKAAA